MAPNSLAEEVSSVLAVMWKHFDRTKGVASFPVLDRVDPTRLCLEVDHGKTRARLPRAGRSPVWILYHPKLSNSAVVAAAAKEDAVPSWTSFP
jgi:hypothetical protein